mgnify:CR=1 FL=1
MFISPRFERFPLKRRGDTSVYYERNHSRARCASGPSFPGHHLDPVVLLGANGLTNAVLHEIDRALNDHELIKVRVPSDDREELESIYAEVAEKLGAARVQMIGKLLIFWRPATRASVRIPMKPPASPSSP